MEIGKLDSKLLEDIVFKHIKYKRPEVLSRAGIGKDCAVVDFGDDVCIMSTDPITGAVEEIGRLAIHISCNDIASNGVEPLGIMLAVMLPPDITEAQIEKIMRQAGEEAASLGVEIIGGHTEITAAVNQPIIVSTAIGRAKKGGYVTGDDIKIDDVIIMTKFAGMEGTGIVAFDCHEALSEFLSQTEIAEARALLGDLSVKTEGLIAGKLGASAMHDVTEGGVLGAIWEICQTSHVGAEIYLDKIPVAPVTHKICLRYNIDPYKLISSGCMIIIIRKEKEKLVLDQLKQAGILAVIIGKVTKGQIVAMDSEKQIALEKPDSDQLYKLLEACK